MLVRIQEMTRVCIFLMLLMFADNNLQAQVIEGGGTEYANFGGSISKAEKLYRNMAYYEAIPVYEKYLKKNDSTRAMIELADCYRLTSQFDKAAAWYAKAVEKEDATPEAKLYLAQMLQITSKYEEAAKWYAEYKKEAPKDKRTINELQASLNHEDFLNNRIRYTIENLSFNSPGYDFSSTFFNNGLVFSSSRDSAKGIHREHTWTGTQFFDLWHVKGDKTSFEKPKRIKGEVTTKYHEAVTSFMPNKKEVYFTRNNIYNNKVKTDGEKVVKLNIYSSEVDGLKWNKDKPFQYNNNEYSVGHPALSADGEVLYFVSDMPGGYGQTDIYMSTLDGNSWSEPVNLGPGINTEGREMFPYVTQDGDLYIASDGHGGLGGLDIFKVKRSNKNKKVTWGDVRNVGAPINSSYDDFSFHFGSDNSYGYFTSNRPGGKGLDDIYSFTDEGVSLEGIVIDAETGEPICNSLVVMVEKELQDEKGRKITMCTGDFEFSVLKSTGYCFKASAEGYIANNDVCTKSKGVGPGGKVFVKIPLKKQRPVGLVVLVRDKQTKRPIDSALVTLTGSCNGIRQNLITGNSGTVCDSIKCECNYIGAALAHGYLPGSNTISTVGRCDLLVKCGDQGGDTLVIELDRIAPNNEDGIGFDPNTAIVLEDIYYDFDKWYIRKEAEKDLNKLLFFMKENPDAIVEIGSHTDARAPFNYNIKLSQRRAQSVVDWLASKGISKNRMIAKGYGETQLRNNCTDNVFCSEYDHQRNRRTEFRVIGGKINLKSLERFNFDVDPCLKCPF